MDADVHILRVFADGGSHFGNPVGILTDENITLTPEMRQSIASRLGYSETVFVDNPVLGIVSLYNPESEVSFAGHALIGASYFLRHTLGHPMLSLQCKAGHIKTYEEDNITWIETHKAAAPRWNFRKLKDASAVDALNPDGLGPVLHTVFWAWMDEDKGLIRARTLAPDWGIPEDEANGSGAVTLTALHKKPLEIRHGKGSVIFTRPLSDIYIGVGGRVENDQTVKIADGV